jgi:hypothetical protein
MIPGSLCAPRDQSDAVNKRVGIGILGLVTTLLLAVVTLGTATIATFATLIAWAIMRRRGSELTRRSSWIVGVGTVGVVVLIAAGGMSIRAKPGTFASFRQAMDSSSKVPPPPPPEWVRRMTPPAAQVRSQVTEKLIRTPAFTIWVLVMTFAFIAGIVAAITGSLGWLSAVMLIYAWTGKGIGKRFPLPIPDSPVRPDAA